MLIHKLQCLRMETLARAWRSLTNKISIHRRFAAQAGNIWKKKKQSFLEHSPGWGHLSRQTRIYSTPRL